MGSTFFIVSGLSFSYISNTPEVEGRDISWIMSLGSGVENATCDLVSEDGVPIPPSKNCECKKYLKLHS